MGGWVVGFFFNDTATTEIYTLSLHDALPIYCSCDRGYPLLKNVNGRTFDVVKAPNGNKLGGTFWTILFRQRPGIYKFQVVQKASGIVIIKYLPDPGAIGLPETSKQFFREKIAELCGRDFTISFESVEKIETTNSGKTRIVVSE